MNDDLRRRTSNRRAEGFAAELAPIETDRVCLDAVLWQREERFLFFADIGFTQVVAALELLGGQQ